MPDLSQAYDALKKADAAGNTSDAKALADYIRSASPPEKENQVDAAPQEDPTSLKNLAGAAVEPMLSMVSGGLAAPVSGLAGLGAGALNSMGFGGMPAADVVNKVRDAMTYQPRTTGGKNAMQAFTAIPEAIGGGMQDAQNKARARVGTQETPLTRLGDETVPAAVSQLIGMKGGAKLAETPGIAKPKPVSPEIKALADKGVVTTPGQRGGIGSWRDAAEQKLKSLPVGGQSIENRRGEAVKRWSEEKVDDALKDAGAPPVPANKTGRDRYFHAYTEIQKKYNSLLPQMTGDLNSAPGGGTSLHTDLSQIRSSAAQKGQGMRPTEQKRVMSIIDDDVMARFDANGKASGKVLGEIKDTLDKEIKNYQSGNVSERKVSQALEQVRGKVNDMIRRENPKLKGDLDKVDKAYSKYQQALLASRIAGKGKEGAFTPNQYLRATERRDASKNKNKFGTGQAPGQKEAESASKILGDTVPDSGTPARLELMHLLKNPWASAGGLASSTVTPLLYSRPVQKLLQNRALKGSNKPATGTGALLGLGATQPPGVDQNGIAQ
jgi:hypothetical protein